MKCGGCGEPMEDGRVEIHGTLGGFLAYGFSLQDLYWYDRFASKASQVKLIDSGTGAVAFTCKACGLVTIDTTTFVRNRRGRGI